MFDEKIVKNYDKMTGFHSIKLENGEVFSYPKTEAGPEGYRWFVDNHKGLKKDRITKVNMPNTRRDMVFLEYLEAMEPRVKRTGNFIAANNNSNKGNNKGGKNNKAGAKKNNFNTKQNKGKRKS